MRMHANWKEGAGRKVLAALLSASLVMQGLPTAALAEAADVDVATEATDVALDTLEATATLDAQALAECVRSAAAEDASQEELARALVEALAGEELPADKETAQAFAEAARALGLESEAVEGADGSAWNLVCIDGAWYHVDVVKYAAEREALGEEAAAQWLFVTDEAMASHEGRGSWVLADDAEAEVPAAPANLADALMLATDEAAAEQAEPESDEQTDPEVVDEAAGPEAAEEQVEPEAAEEQAEPEITEEQVEPEVTEEATEPEPADELSESEEVAVQAESEEATAEAEEVADVDQAEPTATEPADVEPAPQLTEDTALEEPLYAEGNVPIKVRFNAYYDRAHEMLSLVNSSRAAAGVGGVSWDGSLEQYTLQRAAELTMSRTHNRPDGSGLANASIPSYKPGCIGQENLQWATWAITPSELNREWDNSTGHHNTRVTEHYTCYAASIVEVDGVYYVMEALSTGTPSNSYFRTGNNVFGSTWVQLSPAFTSMHMSPDEVTVNEGQTTTSTPYVVNSYQSSDVFSWRVANPSIASVTAADGPLKIKGLSAGTTTITGTAAAGSVSLKVTVKSTKVNVLSVTMSKSSLSMSTGDTWPLSATVYPSNATNKSLTWSSSNSSVASVDSSGKVTAKSAGTATIYATANNGVRASCSVTVSNKLVLSASTATITADGPVTYDGYVKVPTVTVKYQGRTLSSSNDYSLSSRYFTNAGTYKITAEGKGKYTGSISTTFTINPADINGGMCYFNSQHFKFMDYTGSALMPKPIIKVYMTGDELVEGRDYTLSYENNVSSGTATVIVKGKGNYTGERRIDFTIRGISLSEATVTPPADQTYSGRMLEPNPKVTYGNKTLVKGTDYTLSYTNNTNAGTATVTITGKGGYTGTRTTKFKIKQCDFSSSACRIWDIPNQTYTGKPITPEVMVIHDVDLMGLILEEGTNYTLSYANNTNAGTATVSVTGKGNYTGTKTATFTINRKALPSNAVTLSATSYTYDGKAKSPTVTVKDGTKTLTANTDYTLTAPSGRTNAGTYTYTVTGKGNYTGTASASFTITKPQAKNLSSCTVTLSNASYTYDGKAKSPTITVKDGSKTLTAGTDYTLTTPSGRTNAGTYTYTVTGKGGYTGTATAKLTIKPASIASAVVDMPTNVLPTDGEPASTLTLGGKTLVRGADYEVTYDGASYADFWGYYGSHTATFTGKGNYTGTVSADFLIQMADLGTITYRIDWIPDQAYTGSAITPHVSVYKFLGEEGEEALVQGTDYTVSYRNNVQVGTATAIVTGTGRYTGTREITFTIVGTDGRFPDVRQGSWYYNVVNRAAALGLVSGYDNGNFGPNNNVTRGQVAVMLWNMAGRPGAYGWKQFPDAVAGKYYYEAVKWAAGAGVVHGYGDGTYRPDDLVTREQLATMLANYAKRIGWLAVEGSADDYAGMSDAGNVSRYARQSVGWCFRNGIISGKADGTLDPQGNATRAETAKMLVVLYDMLA